MQSIYRKTARLSNGARMKYQLMHKDVHVLDMDLDDSQGTITSIDGIFDFKHLPIGTFQKEVFNGNDFKHWWIGRSIPASRSGLKGVLEHLDIPTPTLLISKCMGLSLSDQYWIRPSDSDIKWKDVNFFSNEFSEDVGDLLFGNMKNVGDISLNSPDNTSDGVLKKRWKIVNGKRCLIKSGGGPSIQEPFNEVIASMLMDSQGIDCCHYSLIWENDRPCCICEDFIDESTEFVTASSLMQSFTSKHDGSVLERYLKSCNSVGVDAKEQIDKMIVMDYLLMNTDRHLGNFGLIRNANDLGFVKAAPLFDNGTSLGCDLLTREFAKIDDTGCKPFAKSFEQQLKLVTSFQWVDVDSLHSTIGDVESLLHSNDFIDQDRIDAILGLLNSRIDSLEEYIER